MESFFKFGWGMALTALLATFSLWAASIVPMHLISGSVLALLLGMALNPIITDQPRWLPGIRLVSKQVLRLAIVMMGLSLSFAQVFSVGKFSLFVMIFTLFTAFGGGYLVGKVLGLNWKLAGLISAGTGICGGSAIAAVAPTIEADDADIAYAISATFLFDILMVILFPLAGVYLAMSDLGFGLWAGTAINDTSSVVAAGYTFSDMAGNFAVIVKLTRTLAIIPTVLLFSWAYQRSDRESSGTATKGKNVQIGKIFPFFILGFLVMVGLKSTGLIPASVSMQISEVSKFLMVMALGAIGLSTNFKRVSHLGFRPMLHGFVISSLVVVVSFAVQFFLGQL